MCFRSQVQIGAFSNYVEVGCVEKFQGNEKSVIIFSTVKSKERLRNRNRVKGVNGNGRGPPRRISAGVSLCSSRLPTFEIYQYVTEFFTILSRISSSIQNGSMLQSLVSLLPTFFTRNVFNIFDLQVPKAC